MTRRGSSAAALRGLLPAALALAAAVPALAQPAAADDDNAWPAEVVRIEQLSLLTPLQLKLPYVLRQGRVRGPAVLKAHVADTGEVRRVAVVESSGNHDHDTAAAQALRSARFAPYRGAGETAVDVTLVVPLHFSNPRQPASPLR